MKASDMVGRMMNKSSRPRTWSVLMSLLALVVLLGATAPLGAATSIKANQIPLTGLTGLGNNVDFAFNRYVFVAPYAPSPVDDENDLSQYDNHYLYILDTKKSNGAPIKIDLTWFDRGESLTNRMFYPTKVLFEPNTSTLFVRGSRFVPSADGYDQVEMIGYLHLNLDDNGKPVADQFIIPVDIQGVGSETCADAPIDFALGQDGKYLVFSNGADVFTYSVSEGYIYRIEIVHPTEFDPASNSISFLNVDPQTNIISVVYNQTKTGDDGSTTTRSEISLYGLSSDGTMPLLKRVFADTFPDGAYLTAGSNIAISSSDKGVADSAWFVTADGVLNQIDLKNSPDTVLVEAKAVQTIPELATEGAEDPGPRLVTYDSDHRTVLVVSKGYTAQISRPSNGRRRGGISRPSNGHRAVEAASLAMVRLNKKNKVQSHASITEPFADGDGLSNAVSFGNGQWMLSTYSGTLFSVTLADDLTQVSPTALGSIGSRVEQVSYFEPRNNVIGINSFELDETGLKILDPGSVSIAKFFDSSTQSASLDLSAQASGTSSITVSKKSNIRRPCNDKR